MRVILFLVLLAAMIFLVDATAPTKRPTTQKPTKRPSHLPTKRPSKRPSRVPTRRPTTLYPSVKPTRQPVYTVQPTKRPTTLYPSTKPTRAPIEATQKTTTMYPSAKPTRAPIDTSNPTKRPITQFPSRRPTHEPTTSEPSPEPTKRPTTLQPTKIATDGPTLRPTEEPTLTPSHAPTLEPTTAKPTQEPTLLPTIKPTTAKPTTGEPTPGPTKQPTLFPPPNMLLLIADDFKPLVGAYKSPKVKTEVLDRFAKQSIAFMNAHAQMSICGPSRSSFLTGLRPDTIQVHSLNDNILHYKYTQAKTGKGKNINLLPKLFKDNGYRTIGVGKIFHEAEFNLFSAADVWSVPMYSWVAGVKRQPVFTKPYQGAWISSADMEDSFFPDAQAAQLAAKLISDDLAVNDSPEDTSPQPWFLAVGLWKPHLPWVAPKRFFEKAGAPQDYVPYHNSDKVQGLTAAQYEMARGDGCGEVMYYTGPPKVLDFAVATNAEMQRAIWAYHATAMFMDEQMGIVLDALDKSSCSDNTLIVFLGDHGFHLGDHGLFGKHTNFEQSTKVPFMVRPPRRETWWRRGTQSFAPVELLDLMPTVVDLTGVEYDTKQYVQLEGKSLLPILQDPENGYVKQGAVTQYFRGMGSARRWGIGVRTTRYRYTEWDATGGKFAEVYDYLEDPWETKIVKNETIVANLKRVFNRRLNGEDVVPFDFDSREAMRDQPTLEYP